MRSVAVERQVRTPVVSTSVMDSTMKVISTLRQTSLSLKWGAINIVLLAIVMYDLSDPCSYYPMWVSLLELVVAVTLIICILLHLGCYLWNILTVQPVVLTPRQMKLLGIKKPDLYFKVSPEVTPSQVSPKTDLKSTTPLNFSATSWLSSSYLSSGRSDSMSPNFSMAATSWEYIPASPISASRSDYIHSSPLTATSVPVSPISSTSWGQHLPTSPVSAKSWSEYISTSPVSSTSWGQYISSSPLSAFSCGVSPVASPQLPPTPTSLFDITNFINTSSVEVIEDEKSLSRYLQEFKEFECSFGSPGEQTSRPFVSSWMTSPTRMESEIVASPRSTYQLACPSPVLSPGSPGGTESGSPSLQKQKCLELWRRVGVKPSRLTQWNANLRQWISQTILENLVKEIQSVDEAFQRHGLTDMKIGFVSLERLKKSAQMAQVVHNIPTLPQLVRFLDASPNQEYIVSRIRDLAKGGCMSDFRWNSGGSLHDKGWEEHLPTDSALVLHFLASYLDTQLPPLPHSTDMRPFSSVYLVKYSEKIPANKTSPIIQEVQLNPPHYVLAVEGDKLEVDPGRNNLFHTFILFLHHMKTHEAGMLGRINLGPSGLNLLWVIES